ncbi:LacI family DNA-binding transcriptional regulator [Phyllobacterium sp. SB3]|uniref:LacI family DNA-binding transcriptional regulator n=1 Tax=Phyllobacterium sp. SB3 TaxID=3156073 RepID=UPI0032AFEBE2
MGDQQVERRRRSTKTNPAQNNATVNDVAKLAGVSTATVSRTLNSPDVVRPEVRERVTMAIQKLGYIPNDSARALRQNQTRLIGVVVPTLSYALYADFFASLQKTLAEKGFFALLTTSEYDLQSEAEQAAKLIRQGAQGLVLVGRLRDKQLSRLLATSGVPYVTAYVFDPTDTIGSIGFDNARAVSEVVNYLVSLGHRKIAMLTGLTTNRNDRALARVQGYVTAMNAHQLPSDEWIAQAPYTIIGGRTALQEIFDKSLQPTAIVCGSDMLAIGALQECKARNIQVPQDISIVGFDDLEIAAHIEPPLTTVSVPSVSMGKAVGERIVEICLGLTIPSTPAFETSLIVRKTTAAPRD